MKRLLKIASVAALAGLVAGPAYAQEKIRIGVIATLWGAGAVLASRRATASLSL